MRLFLCKLAAAHATGGGRVLEELRFMMEDEADALLHGQHHAMQFMFDKV
jgi:hypothetical protein